MHLRAISIIKDLDDNGKLYNSFLTLSLIYCQAIIILSLKMFNKNPNINSPLNFLRKTLNLLRYIRYDVIFHSLAVNQRSFSEPTIQRELYALLRMALNIQHIMSYMKLEL